MFICVSLNVMMTEDSEAQTLALEGEFDVYTVRGFRRELQKMGHATGPVIVDLSGVTFLDSSGLDALVCLAHQTHAHEEVVGVICPSTTLRRMMEIAGLHRTFAIGRNLTEVRRALQSGLRPQP